MKVKLIETESKGKHFTKRKILYTESAYVLCLGDTAENSFYSTTKEKGFRVHAINVVQSAYQ